MEIQAKEDVDMQKKWWHDKVAYQIYPKSFAIQTEMGSVICGALFPNWTI